MAEKPKRKQKPKAKLNDPEQSERFKETARKLGIAESKTFASVVLKIAPKKK